MLKTFSIFNFRGFESFSLQGLSRVNLLVGKNNSGKTSLLEAMAFATAGGDLSLLINFIVKRGELGSANQSIAGNALLDISHLFHGHRPRAGDQIRLTGDGIPETRVSIAKLDGMELVPPNIVESVFSVPPSLRLKLERGGQELNFAMPILLSEEGMVVHPRGGGSFRPLSDKIDVSVGYIPPEGIHFAILGPMWDRIINEKQEKRVVDALKILQPDLVDVVFTSTANGVLVGLANESKRVPIGSMGDGIRRLLALAIALSHAKGGNLFIDEIDSGLHYSVMADTWKLVVETARRLNVQVFATTHSWDCLEGLGELCRGNPEAASEVSVQKIVPTLKQSVSFSGDRLPLIVDNRTEVR